MGEENTHSAEEGVAEKCEELTGVTMKLDAEGGGEAGRSQSQYRHKKA